jgi:hypothetical protein
MNEANIFSVTSNSTVASIVFNSSRSELSFDVSGPSGTWGYVQVSIPKTMVNDIEALDVLLDDDQVQYNYETRGNVWLISFAYHHSSHDIIMALNGYEDEAPNNNNNNTDITSNPWMIIAIVAIVIAVIAIVISLRTSRRK